MWMQMMDGGRYRLVDGNVSPYVSTELYEHTPIVRVLIKPGADAINPPPDAGLADSVIEQLELGAVVVFDAPDRPAEVSYIRQVFGGSESTIGTCAVFDLTSRAKAVSASHSRVSNSPDPEE